MLQPTSLQFLEDLKANNNRDWFLQNQNRYELYKKDYHQLVGLILDALKPSDSSLEMLEIKNCIFRINRDIRFSKDKTPYKTHLSIWISGGAKGLNRAGYYIHIDKDDSFIAGGMYCPEAADLKKIRSEIAYFHEDLNEVLGEKNFKKEFKYFDISDSNILKNAPKDYEKDHVAIEFLKLKSFTTTQKIDISDCLKPDFVAKITKKLLVLKPLNDFLNRAL